MTEPAGARLRSRASYAATARVDTAADTAAAPDRSRLVGLDGVRGLAALFVVLHHCYLMSFPGYPANTGPQWMAWLLYGRLAVVVFIVLSGFSLGVSPARRGWRLGGVKRFAHRRAWRILPPYWAALALSLVIAWAVVPQPGSVAPNGRTVVVYGLLLQDVFGAPDPNGSLWSIAVEAQLYFVFPLLVLILRRAGAAVMVGAVTVVVGTLGVLATRVPTAHLFLRLTPQFAVLFALGLAAAGILRAGERIRRLPLPWLAALAAVPVLAVTVVLGSVWWDAHLFWMDLAIGPAVALLLAALATRRPAPLVRLLDTRPVRRLGLFSYSLYLIHAPLVVAINEKIVRPYAPPGLPTFWLTLGIAAPASVLAAWAFATVFEIPFQRYRSWAALGAAMGARWARLRRAGPPRSAAAYGRDV